MKVRFILCLIYTLLLSACQLDYVRKRSVGQELKIVATTGFIADAVKNIVGDRADVQAIMGPGVDPHLYKASQGDLQKFLDADVIFYGGLHLEGKMTEVLEKLGRLKPVFGLGDELPKALLIRDEQFASSIDPHIWFDISLWKLVVRQITEHLTKLAPEHQKDFVENSNKYLEELDLLEAEVREGIRSIPEQRRIMITAHDAFHYMGRGYNLEVRGLQGISTTAEFGLRDVSDLVNLVLERRIKAVFVETSVSDRALKAVLAGVRERGGQLSIGGHLYSDAMGNPGTSEGTYIGMYRHNLQTIVNALK